MSDVYRAAFAALVFATAAVYRNKREKSKRAQGAQAEVLLPSTSELQADHTPETDTAEHQQDLTFSVSRSAIYKSSLLLLLGAGIALGLACFHRTWGAIAALLMLPGLPFLPFWDRAEAKGRNEQRFWGIPARLQQQKEQEGQRTKARQLAAYLHAVEGSWIKDKIASDSMEPALDLMCLGRLVRSAVRLVKGIRLRVYNDCFEMAVFSAIPWFKVVETYPLSGSTVSCKRRDLRRGRHKGRASITEDGEVALALVWGEPFGGTGTELFHLVDDNTLHVTSSISVAGQTVSYTNIHRREV